MRFCQYETNYGAHLHKYGSAVTGTPEVFYRESLRHFKEEAESNNNPETKEACNSTLHELSAEFAHSVVGRPYYNVYPCIIDMCKRLPSSSALRPLHFPGIVVAEVEENMPLQALELRFPDNFSIRAMLVCVGTSGTKQKIIVATNWQTPHPQESAPFRYGRGGLVFGTSEDDQPTIDEAYRDIAEEAYDGISPDREAAAKADLTLAMRVVVCLGLLVDQDLGLLERDLLTADRGKPPTENLLRRATVRKGLGWNLGRELEATPHTRRPHWAVRHCGPGGKDARLRPISGSIVKRKKLTTLPTGDDREETIDGS